MRWTTHQHPAVAKALADKAIRSAASVAATMVVVLVLPWAIAPAYADRTEAVELVEQAQELLDQGQHEQARKQLAVALKADPTYPEVHAQLGFLHEASGEIERAVDCYGQVLQLAPNHSHARARMRYVFYQARFPRWVKLDYLKYSPISVVVDKCQVRLPGADALRSRRRLDFAYTTSLLFPEEMGRSDPAPRIPIPAGQYGRAYATVNRVCYGLVGRPNSQVTDLRFVVQYPSQTISHADNDYSQLATTITHLLLRFSGYAAMYLNRPPTGDDEGLVHVYLCEPGPAGAEQYENNIYFYDIDQPRTAAEWAREVAHELGHSLLPAVGRFDEPEEMGGGLLGERLFTQWLAAEAELVTGARWPSQTVADAVGAVLNGDGQKVADYIQEQCRPALDLWLREGPESALVQAKSAEAMDYFTGFCLWVLAAQGPQVLAEILDNTPGENPAPTDFLATYREIVTRNLEVQAWRVNAGALNPAQSRLAQLTQEGAVRREEITLGPGDTALLPVFLPAGAWVIAAEAVPSGESVNLEFRLGEQTLVSPSPLTIFTDEAGWHTVRLSVGGDTDQLHLQGIRIEQAPQV